MLIKFFQVFILLVAVNVFAFDTTKDFKGFVNIGVKELYVDYLAPVAGRPTVVLLNGLTYETTAWDKMTAAMKKKGLGVVRYDMDGMGKTLAKYGVKMEPYAYSDQVLDLNHLLKTLNIPLPYNLVGLSYGGGIAAAYSFKFPETVGKAILMAPYTEALQQQDQWIKSQIWSTRLQFPYNPYSDEQLYDYFLKQICYTTYPNAEPSVLTSPYKLEAVFRMTQGIRKFRVVEEVNRFPKKSVYLVIAEKDQYIPREVLETFWTAIPAYAKVEKILIKNSEHKMPEAQPQESANVVDRIVSN
ncbi:MAG: alpha/beta hydrolase [Bdellovibrio sp.]|nr:alpha/beta hydrolase [Bdellovibrio sp.]